MSLRRQFGFTLVEVLAAFTILAVTLTVLFNGVSQSVEADLRAKFELQAARIARSEFDKLGVLSELAPGNIEGRTEGLQWTISLTPYAEAGDNRAFWARIVVKDRRRSFQALTLKLQDLKEAPP